MAHLILLNLAHFSIFNGSEVHCWTCIIAYLWKPLKMQICPKSLVTKAMLHMQFGIWLRQYRFLWREARQKFPKKPFFPRQKGGPFRAFYMRNTFLIEWPCCSSTAFAAALQPCTGKKKDAILRCFQAKCNTVSGNQRCTWSVTQRIITSFSGHRPCSAARLGY